MPKPRWTKKALARLAAGGGNSAMTVRNTGQGFERTLADTHAAYETAGIATIEKVAPPVLVIHGPPKRFVLLENPFVDFVGTWTARNGRSVHMEAKSTTTDRLAINTVPKKGKSVDGVKKSQIESMQRWRAAGALVCVLWHFEGEVRYLSLALIEARIANGAKSILWAHADPVAPGLGFILHDWLKNLAAEHGLQN